MSTSFHIPEGLYPFHLGGRQAPAGVPLTVLLRRAVADLQRWLQSTWAAGMVPANAERVPELSVVCVAGEGDGRGRADLICPIRSEPNVGLAALMVVGPRFDGRPYSEDERQLADSLCRHIGGVLGSDVLARRISDDLNEGLEDAETARGIYERLDHGNPGQRVRGIEYGGQCDRAEQTCGDLFDLLPQGKEELVVAVGKVDARGLPAGILMGGVLGAVRALVGRKEPLEQIVAELNRTLWDVAPEGHFTSFLCGRVEPGNRCLRYVNAGHEPALLLRGGGQMESLEATGAVLGLCKRSMYRERVVLFEPGDLLAAFTEGVAEPAGPEGVARILREGAGCGVQDLASQVLAQGRPEADRTVVIVRFCDAMAMPVPVEKAALAAA